MTQRARKLLEEDFVSQLEGVFDVLPNGTIAAQGGTHLSAQQVGQRNTIVAALEHKRTAGLNRGEAVAGYVRDAAFTTLNRFVALKMLEARALVQECIAKGEQSAGYREYCGMAPGVALLSERAGYRLYLESLFDELSTEVKVLFDRRDTASILWPRRPTFDKLLALLNSVSIADVWAEDETIGWVYQFFNSNDERRQMREESQAPRNSHELAVRNQFFTPRYVVQFLTDNTLGRTWLQMQRGETILTERCAYLVRGVDTLVHRAKKDPRDIKVLDPACGSGHFLLYAFDLFLSMYEEAWADPQTPPASSGATLRVDFPTLGDLHRVVPALIVQHNLYGADIDPRAVQIAGLTLWLRAQRAFSDLEVAVRDRVAITRTHIVVAEPIPGDQEMVSRFAEDLHPPFLRDLFRKMVGEMHLAGELGPLLRVEEGIAAELRRARDQFLKQRQVPLYLPDMETERRQGELDLSGIDDSGFFREAETLIVDTLRRFSEASTSSGSVRGRLFAGDAAQGIALVDLLLTRFDVVLMNPPFGSSSLGAKKEFETSYPRTKNDLFAAFVERGVELLCERGMLGAITSRAGFFLSSFQRWREEILLREAPPVVFADLGYGVLDSAMVEVAAYVLQRTAY
jgi:hypothetical protein